MYAEILTARIGMLKNSITWGKDKFLSLILTLIIVSYVAVPDNSAETLNKKNAESVGLIAVNYLQIA